MKKGFKQIRNDIMGMQYSFKKSKELAPFGYKFLTNYDLENERTKEDDKDLDWYMNQGYIIIPMAFNMYGNKIEGDVAIYTKISE